MGFLASIYAAISPLIGLARLRACLTPPAYKWTRTRWFWGLFERETISIRLKM